MSESSANEATILLTEVTALLAQAEVIEEATGIRPSGIVTANPDVLDLFRQLGFPTILRPNTKSALMYEVELSGGNST